MFTPSREIFLKYMDKTEFDRIVEYPSVSAMWADAAAAYADLPAIVYDGETHTYAQLDADAAAFRAVLTGAGLQKGDTVCLLSGNSYLFVKAYIASVTMGLTVAVLPAQLDEMTVFGCTMMFGARAIVYHPELEGKLTVARAKGVPTISAADTSDKTAPAAALSAADPCVIMFTGGTTGKSKGALLSHGAVMQGTVNGCYGYRGVFNQRYMLVLPLSHVFGLIRNLMTALYTGSTLFICKNNKDMFRDIAMFRPTILVLVPALAEMALNLSRQFGRNMLGADMKTIICGAAAVAPYLVAEYGKMGIALCPGYGLTESANLVSGNPDFVGRPDSVGIMYPNQEYRVQDGELWLKGANMMTEYYRNPAENAAAYTDGWFRTGDLVRFDEEGFLYITGRIKEIIVLSNGENVSPAAVEAVFNTLPTVQDSQLFEDIDEDGQHILALEVVPRMTELKRVGGDNPIAFLTAQLEEINKTLPGYEQAVRITVRDSDFARTPSMKIVRYKKC